MNREKFEMFLGLMIGTLVALIIPFVSHFITFGDLQLSLFEYLRSFILNVVVGFFVGSWVPAIGWGEKLCDVFRIQKEIPRYLLSVLVLAIVMVGLLSCTLIFIDMGFDPDFFSVWGYTYSRMIFAAYPLLLIAVKLGEKIALKVCVK